MDANFKWSAYNFKQIQVSIKRMWKVFKSFDYPC